MPHIGQAKGGFNRLQQRIVGLEARILHATHAVVRDGDEHHAIVEVGRIVAVGTRQQWAGGGVGRGIGIVVGADAGPTPYDLLLATCCLGRLNFDDGCAVCATQEVAARSSHR